MINVYYANVALLKEEKDFELWFSKMHSLRKEKILRCKQELDKKRSLLAGILLKIAVEREGLCYEHLDFEVQEHGKTIFKNLEGYEFSISHAGNYALCCISNSAVGADIEVREKSLFQEAKRENFEQMAKRVLVSTEYESFMKVDGEERIGLFLKYWTRKESYSKAEGCGLQMDFSKVDTEHKAEHFVSDWLEDDCFYSIYSESEVQTIQMHRIESLDA